MSTIPDPEQVSFDALSQIPVADSSFELGPAPGKHSGPDGSSGGSRQPNEFVPPRPGSLDATGLSHNDVIPLLVKLLYLQGPQAGRQVSEHVKLPFVDVVEPLLSHLRTEGWVGLKAATPVGDYVFELLPKGSELARRFMERSTYCGAAPVCLEDYEAAVLRQSVKRYRPRFADVERAMEGLIVSEMLISQVGQAVASGRSMFLYGSPGNGKSTIARRSIRAVAETIWIPRCITVGGEIIRIYDPSLHDEAPYPETSLLATEYDFDARWVRIHRPCVVVGGELTIDHLEATVNAVTGIIEAPVHVKSNCGCLVVDDFGRQQISTSELLNRWIVPMECGHDFLTLPSGRQVRLPFEQLLIFSTNLEPGELCDEAFLRRIPYKIEIFDPSEQQFRDLFELRCDQLGIEYSGEVLDYLIEYQYKRVGRPMRFCHVEDLLNQVKDFCEFHGRNPSLSIEIAQLACLNYFSGMTSKTSKQHGSDPAKTAGK